MAAARIIFMIPPIPHANDYVESLNGALRFCGKKGLLAWRSYRQVRNVHDLVTIDRRISLMLDRRHVLLLGVLAAVSTGTPVMAADPAAQAFLVSLYNNYKGKGGNGVALDKEAVVRRYFEPALAALIIKDRKDAESRGDVPSLDGDPFVDAQDWEIAAFDIAVRDTAPNKATGTVKFQNFDKAVTVVLDLVKLREGWRIADITWQRDGENSTLRSLFGQ
jgi:hypothetical protein